MQPTDNELDDAIYSDLLERRMMDKLSGTHLKIVVIEGRACQVEF
jgi:hypothetical protein